MIYDAKCEICGKIEEYVRSASECYDTPVCCGKKMQKVILSAPVGYVQNISYTSPIDGRPITTKRARMDDLARNNCRPWEGMEQETKEAQRRAAYEEAKQDAKIEKAVTDAYQQLKPEQRRLLEKAD